MTTFGDQVFQFGGMPLGEDGTPFGYKAKTFFVDSANGSDNNPGRSIKLPLDTVGAAYALTTDKAGDIIYFLNDGNTTGSSREATIPITWSNDNTHLRGRCAPVRPPGNLIVGEEADAPGVVL